MIKISATISKKVPIPKKDYSSQAFGASLEIEVSDSDKPEAIQGRIRDLYGLLSRTIDEQIAGATNDGVASSPPTTPATSVNRVGNASKALTNGNGHGRKTTATEAQQRAIYAICKNLNLDIGAVLADHNVADPAQLNVKDASLLIDSLKSRQNSARRS